MEWIPAANGRMPAGRIILRIGYAAAFGRLPTGRSILRVGRPAATGRIPTWRSIIRGGYPPLMGGYLLGGVSYGFDTGYTHRVEYPMDWMPMANVGKLTGRGAV